MWVCTPAKGAEPAKGDTKQVDLGGGVTLELVYLPPGEFTMGSTPEEKAWAVGPEGGWIPGTAREKPEGDPRPGRIYVVAYTDDTAPPCPGSGADALGVAWIRGTYLSLVSDIRPLERTLGL